MKGSESPSKKIVVQELTVIDETGEVSNLIPVIPDRNGITQITIHKMKEGGEVIISKPKGNDKARIGAAHVIGNIFQVELTGREEDIGYIIGRLRHWKLRVLEGDSREIDPAELEQLRTPFQSWISKTAEA